MSQCEMGPATRRGWRRFLLLFIVGLLALCSVPAGCGLVAGPTRTPVGARPDTRPNIVFVLTDDLTVNLLRFMPNVRALQRSGTTFGNHFVVDSLCCPSRAAIFTGKYPHHTGVFTNTGPDGGYKAYNRYGNPRESFAVALHRAGYRTGFFGKYLNGYAARYPGARGWDDWHATGRRGYYGYNYRLRDNGSITRHGNRPADYLTEVLSRKASAFIKRSADSGKPFMMEVATFAPHWPAIPAPRDVGKLRGLRAPRAASFNKRVKNTPRWLSTVPAISARTFPRLDRVFRKRALSVLAVDRMVGRLRQQLRRSGVANNTYVVFSSDNGYHIGQHRLRRGKQTAFDHDIKVPLIVAGPGVPVGRKRSVMTSSIDLCPTFEAIGKAKIGRGVDGVSLLPLWHGRHPKTWRHAVLIEHHNSDGRRTSDPDYQTALHGDPPDYEAVRTTRALYVEYGDGEREYYNLKRDPAELTNRAQTAPRYRIARLHRLLKRLKN